MDEQTNKPFKWCFKMLKIYGLWIDGEETKRYRIYGFCMFFFCPILLTTLQTAGIYQSGISIDSVESLTFIIAGIVEVSRIIILLVNFKSFKNLYITLNEIMKNCIKNDKFIRKRMKFCFKLFIIMESNVTMNILSAIFISIQSQKLPHDVGAPFDIHYNGLGFWIMYCYQFFALLYIPTIFNALIILPIFFMNFLIGFMEDFNERLKTFGMSNRDEKEQKFKDDRDHDELIEFLKIHNKIKQLKNDVSELFRMTFFIASIVGSVLLCSSVFVIPMVKVKLSSVILMN
jgi:hypothetical protein